MQKIDPDVARYIKLGKGGAHEHRCIAEDHTIWLGYYGVPHSLCRKGRWDEVHKHFVESEGDSPGTANNHLRQVRAFYEAGEDELWVTFYANRLWWGFAESEINFHPDKSKTRQIIGGWSSTNINGNPLTKANLSGRLLSMEAYRGTICNVRAYDYLVRKINDESSPEEKAATEARKQMTQAVEKIIGRLHWKDFELLIDLIFREAGWQRTSVVGGPQEAIDLELSSPIHGESYTVQIKSKAGRQEFERYQEQTSVMSQFTRHYFVVHKPSKSLAKQPRTGSYEVWLPEKIADLSIRYGLVDWIIQKAI